jgi:hypothetical protein
MTLSARAAEQPPGVDLELVSQAPRLAQAGKRQGDGGEKADASATERHERLWTEEVSSLAVSGQHRVEASPLVYPHFGRHAKRMLDEWAVESAHVEHLLEGLRKAEPELAEDGATAQAEQTSSS